MESYLNVFDAQTEILRWLESLGHEVIYDMPIPTHCDRCKLDFSECYCPDNIFLDLNLERDEILKQLAQLNVMRRALTADKNVIWA